MPNFKNEVQTRGELEELRKGWSQMSRRQQINALDMARVRSICLEGHLDIAQWLCQQAQYVNDLHPRVLSEKLNERGQSAQITASVLLLFLVSYISLLLLIDPDALLYLEGDFQLKDILQSDEMKNALPRVSANICRNDDQDSMNILLDLFPTKEERLLVFNKENFILAFKNGHLSMSRTIWYGINIFEREKIIDEMYQNISKDNVQVLLFITTSLGDDAKLFHSAAADLLSDSTHKNNKEGLRQFISDLLNVRSIKRKIVFSSNSYFRWAVRELNRLPPTDAIRKKLNDILSYNIKIEFGSKEDFLDKSAEKNGITRAAYQNYPSVFFSGVQSNAWNRSELEQLKQFIAVHKVERVTFKNSPLSETQQEEVQVLLKNNHQLSSLANLCLSKLRSKRIATPNNHLPEMLQNRVDLLDLKVGLTEKTEAAAPSCSIL